MSTTWAASSPTRRSSSTGPCRPGQDAQATTGGAACSFAANLAQAPRDLRHLLRVEPRPLHPEPWHGLRRDDFRARGELDKQFALSPVKPVREVFRVQYPVL